MGESPAHLLKLDYLVPLVWISEELYVELKIHKGVFALLCTSSFRSNNCTDEKGLTSEFSWQVRESVKILRYSSEKS